MVIAQYSVNNRSVGARNRREVCFYFSRCILEDVFPTEIETDRLELRQFSQDTVSTDEFYNRFSVAAPYAEEIFNHISDDLFATEKDVLDFIEQMEAEWADSETAAYTVYPDASEDGSGELAGYAHLWMKWERRKAELGLVLDKPFWGREYAGEVYLALTKAVFDLRGIELIEIGHPVPNTNSQRSIEKFIEEAGGQFDGVIHNNEWCRDELVDSRRYSVSKEDFSSVER